MALNSEIEKLERRWLENPLGLTFATLAEAYRKAGDTARALEVLELGLAQHPNYVPAHIVRGRCHLDAGADALAEAAFQRVIELDRENVIALNGLAEISERGGRLAEAASRLESLLDIDRNNEVARGQLDRVRELMSQPAAAAPAPEPAAPPPAGEPEATPAGERLGFEPLYEMDAAELTPVGASEFQLDSDAETLAPSEERIAEVILGAESPELDGLLGGEYASLIPYDHSLDRVPPPAPAADVEPVAEPTPVVVEPFADVVEVDLPPPPAPVMEPEPAAMAEPELVVTETMAEIFLRQGHRELALAVYQQLLLREPENQRIASAVDALKPTEPAPEPLPEPEPARDYAAAGTGGRSVGQLFEGLLGARRPAATAAVHPPAYEDGPRADAAPTRATEDTLSLSAVFGDAPPPAGPASGSGPAGAEPSFDEFFATAPGEAADSELPRAPTEAGAVSSPVPEDLEQFNAWLRGLKR